MLLCKCTLSFKLDPAAFVGDKLLGLLYYKGSVPMWDVRFPPPLSKAQWFFETSITLYSPTQCKIPEDINLLFLIASNYFMRIDNSYAFSAVYNRAATYKRWNLTESGTDHTDLSIVTPCFAAKFPLLSFPIGPSQSCGLHDFFFVAKRV